MSESALFVVIAILFVTCLLISNIAAQKLINICGFTFTSGVLLFPVTYIFGDVLTECYGYSRARLIIWAGFFASSLMALFMGLVVEMKPAPGWNNQVAFSSIFLLVPRTVLASVIAYCAGEFLNSFTLAKVKLLTNGKHLWMRTIGSTIVGQAVDTVIFLFLAFGGLLPTDLLIRAAWSGYLFKVIYEIAATPLTYAVVNWVKKIEKTDAFDRETNFNPFSLK